ncbi:Crp/Fnr family transcriptional regulator [Sphingomonas sp. IW22]|uniref:Crp/Fnr family transcriptional regulator n=1 Tax=Sphingomonas sp. IW22 TaxID=3242489 RepID=UPI0035228A6A
MTLLHALAEPLSCARCPVRGEAVCAGLDAAGLAELSRLGRHRHFARGETIFAAGDDAVACATLVSGAAKLATTDADGVERIVALVHPAGLLGRLFAHTLDYDAIALGECELCLFPRGDFERLMADYPELARRVLERTLAELDRAHELADLIGRRDARGRVAGLLIAFSRAAGAGCHAADRFDLPLTRGEMAGLLGLSIETVSRQLTAMERDGVIARSGARGIVLHDPRALAGTGG